MDRRPNGPMSGWSTRRGAGRPSGLTGRALVIAAGVVVVVLVLIVLVVSRCGGSKAQAADCSGKLPAPPSGFVYASKYCVTLLDAGKRGSLTVPLTDKSTTRGLSLYQYQSGQWQRVAPVQASPDALFATSTVTIDIPKAFAILRRSSGDLQVLGTIPRGVLAGPDASQLMTAAVPANYSPAPDGSVSSVPTMIPPGAAYQIIPAISAEGGADAQAVTAILGDDTRRSVHVERIAAEADRSGFDGIEVDYPALNPTQRDSFTVFVQALGTKLHTSKRKLVLRLPLPRHDGNTWDTGAYNWPELAKAVDYFVIAAEPDQSIYRTRVPDALKYLSGQVGDSHKLILEVTPSSEDKSEQGQLRTLSTVEALSIAGQITVRDRDKVVVNSDATISADNINHEGGSGVQWTPQAVNAFTYSSGQDQHTVWIENVFSVGFKLEIAQAYGLGGVSVADAAADPNLTNIWPAIEQYENAGSLTLQQPNPLALRPQWLLDDKPLQDAGDRAVITWHTPNQPGRHTLTLIVSDGTLRVANSTDITVLASAPGITPGRTATPGAAATTSRTTSTPRATVSPVASPSNVR